MTTIKHACLLVLLSFLMAMLPIVADGQTATQRERLLELSEQFSRRFAEEKAEALRLADSLGWPVRQEFEDGRVIELMRIREDGMPMYYITHNKEGGELIKSDKVYPGGSAGLNLTGAGQTLGMWDGGAVRLTHQEFQTNGTSRVTQKDGATSLSNHATHVAGTMVAGGVISSARGMSYEAYLDAYDWNNDDAEMAAAAADGLHVSQHSYGYITGWAHGSWSGSSGWHWFGNTSISQTEDYFWGFYSEQAQDWDNIAHNAPTYLIVKSAGNDRGRGPSSGTGHYYRIGSTWHWSTTTRDKDGGADGYQCISHAGNSKNVFTVGAVEASRNMSDFSGWGPTDDGRVKPDIVAKGVSVLSPIAVANSSPSDVHYAYSNGTSMSGPMVSGSVGLLLEHQQNLHPGETLLASTIKALILHSADTDISGAPGPDYRFGWGLMDTEAAANIMTKNAAMGGNFHIREMTLNDQETIELTVFASGEEDLVATIVWTDPPGTPPPPSLNPTDLMLVNDLDMRLTSNATKTEYKPYILDPENPEYAATTGDNFRDNVEQILVSSPANGEAFNLAISHKGSLYNDSQDFSLIITGIAPATYAGNTTDWHDPANWHYGSPEETEHITIPAGLTHFPIIPDEVTINNLSIEAGASLGLASTASVTIAGNLVIQGSTGKDGAQGITVDPGGKLTVKGTLVNYGGSETLVLKSDAGGTASLIHNTPDVHITAERYILGDWSTNLSGWHLLSAPVSDQLIEDFIPQQGQGDYDFYAWDEVNNLWLNQKVPGNNITHFNPGQGYMVSWQNTLTPQFKGPANVDDVAFANLSITPGQGKGWHLIGNPFASGLAWDAGLWDLSGIVHTGKIWSNGGYIDIGSPGGIIPSMNGLFIQADEETNSLVVPADARLHAGSWYKGNNLERIVLMARKLGSEHEQQSIIRIESDPLPEFDRRYDSRYLQGHGPEFYAMSKQEKLSTISIEKDLAEQVISYHFAGTAGNEHHEIRLLEKPGDVSLFLHDTHINQTHKLAENTPVVFYPETDRVIQPRFVLHFSDPGTPTSIPSPGGVPAHKAWYNDGRIFFDLPAHPATIRLYDIQGRLLHTETIGSGGISRSFAAPPRPGIYLLRITGTGFSFVQKVLIPPA